MSFYFSHGGLSRGAEVTRNHSHTLLENCLLLQSGWAEKLTKRVFPSKKEKEFSIISLILLLLCIL